MKLVDKDVLVAEIENLVSTYKKCPTRNNYEEGLKDGRLIGYKDALHKINTFEVKEVDLEKEYEEFVVDDPILGNFIINDTMGIELAKHFFELGIKAQKDNIRHSMNETPNYPCDILFVTDVGNMFLYKYMENGRPVDNETPYFHNILNGKCWYYCNDIVNK